MDNRLEEEVGTRKVREVSMLYMVHAERQPCGDVFQFLGVGVELLAIGSCWVRKNGSF